ncbi:hypothetical protein B9T31_09720 [Acinetobacter sp. ANC 4558]|uniref:phage antirepressor KilAC domain-containing protein n=1 Tax=Acinetobacter sp. ANC 4558 TaxID=1977876 RepID=UPI000A32EBB6|nr:phage antirepressor KilAC domain-containing protein [Acinetobacter sp. ANC 4558]OTG85860.1 hypothetical protein B9T31_09720 [Acinetobacter sp. ANC 4558]
MNAIINLNTASMNSLEISELVQTEHRNVKVSIDRLMKKGVIRNAPMTNVEKINNLGLKTQVGIYVFEGEQGKRDSIIVVAQLCPEFTAALVDRWHHLENQKPRELSRMEILQMALQAEEEKQVLQNQVAILEPKAQALEAIANTNGTYTIRECAKALNVGERKLIDLLLDKKWIYREEHGRLQPYSTKREAGIFINRPSPVIMNKNTGEEKVHLHMRITALGLTKITELINRCMNIEVKKLRGVG